MPLPVLGSCKFQRSSFSPVISKPTALLTKSEFDKCKFVGKTEETELETTSFNYWFTSSNTTKIIT